MNARALEGDGLFGKLDADSLGPRDSIAFILSCEEEAGFFATVTAKRNIEVGFLTYETRHQEQNGVTGGMSMGIVYAFEAIDVEQYA